jgi:hypothetical protein
MPGGGKVQINLTKLLIVEGRDEENFFAAALANHLGIAGIQVLGIGGKTLLTANLKALKNDPAFSLVQCLVVIRDADLTPAGSVVAAATSAFASVCASLTAQGVQLPCPASHAQFAAGPPRVGVFIMPDGTSDGMLETLCTASVAARPEYACVTDFFTCLQGHGVMLNNMHKARAHAWLASQAESGKRVGEAAAAGYWPFADAAFADLWNFLQAM